MKAALYVLLLMLATSAFPWSRYDAHTNPISEEQQQKIEELQRRLEQAEFERQLESADRERAASEAADEARQEAEERAREAAEQAEQDVEDVRNEMIRSAVRTKNNFYLIVLLLLMGVFVTHIIKKFNKEKLLISTQT
jgi:Fe2+ transport system protein B